MKAQSQLTVFVLAFVGLSAMVYDTLSRLSKEQADILTHTATIIGMLSVLIALAALSFQARQAKLQRTYDITEKYRDDNFKIAERFVKYDFADFIIRESVDLSSGLSALRKHKVKLEIPATGQFVETRLDIIVQRVSNYYNSVGTLAAYKTIDTDIFFATAGSDVLLSWSILAPIIISQNMLRHSVRDGMQLRHDITWTAVPYQGGFKYLVDCFEKSKASRAAERIISYGDGLKTIEDPLGIKWVGWW